NREVLRDVFDLDEHVAHDPAPDGALHAPTTSAPRRAFSSALRKQASRCVGSAPVGVASGSCCRQRSNAYAQRGWKRQPCGGRSSDGGCPPICVRRSTVPSSRGSDPRSPHVYG